jgi:tRNA nucleotidyltransferase (CCA-adding enzyme)
VEGIPADVKEVMNRLSRAGYEAWCVGGCVRDLLLGRKPDDWDVTTSAKPEATMSVFGAAAFPTGLRHGTVTVRTETRAVEVTTYRCDGAYADHRHPDSVTFSTSLTEDLRRRDFTVNAMALSDDGMLVDPFGGQTDLRDGVLRCVGEPDVRFGEDALRILRGLRFSAVLGFSIEQSTAESIHKNARLLREIAPERIRVELDKLLCGGSAADVLLAYPDVLGVFLPEILPSVGFDQQNRHHCYDVWEHTARSIEAAPPTPVLRMTMLLHDLGKPACFAQDAQGVGHFIGHPAVSREQGEAILRRLRYEHNETETILTLVAWHDRNIPRTATGVRRALRALGEERFRQLLAVKRADNRAQAPAFQEPMQAELDKAERILGELLEQDACFSLRQLAVNGSDLLALGYAGCALGAELDRLLTAVVDGELENERTVLLQAAETDRETEK